MGKALYRKYRSKSLEEVIGQEHITDTLRRAISSGRISHAYLFTGPRGVGKTSIARILAHELNGVEYSGEGNHLDIIEIDAASNGGVEEIRDLRDKVYISPSSGKYKVYIIDEVHMMTTSAFNALLKTLEEPPEHTIFILATTEAHKLPATIVSRTQRFVFKPIPTDKAIAHLKHIAVEEKIEITDDALALIAEHGEGSFRDSIGMLDQAASSGVRIDRDAVEALLGIPPATVTEDILTAIAQQDTAKLVALLARLRGEGYQAAGVAKQMAQALRTWLVRGQPGLEQSAIIALLSRLIDVPASHNPDQLFELVLLEAALANAENTSPTAALGQPPTQEEPPKAPEPTQASPEQAPSDNTPKVTVESTDHVPETTETASPAHIANALAGAEAWQALLDSLKKQYNTLYGIIRMAKPDFAPGKVTLTFGYAFHQKRANDAKNKKILSTMYEEITGQRIAIACVYDPSVTPPAPASADPKPATAETASQAKPSLGAISTIFGGGEVLQP